MPIRPVDDREQIHTFLADDPVAHAYQLGFLDDAYYQWTKWWGWFEGDALEVLVVLYSGLSVPVVLTVGGAERVSDTYQQLHGELPDRFYCHVRDEHLEGVRRIYDTSALSPSSRMFLRREDFEPPEPNRWVVRLGHRDTAQIIKLYEHYPDNLFEPYQLESGLYFGIHRRSGGELVSITGIHVLSEQSDLAVVGNLVTHPRYRGRNLATTVTGRLLTELFERVSLVALNVAEDNTPAIRTYEHFAFKPHHRFWVGLAKKSEV